MTDNPPPSSSATLLARGRHTVHRLLTTVSWALNDRVMGVLAILAMAGSLYPEMFDVPGPQAFFLACIEWSVVLAFAAEYLVNLALASDRRTYVRNSWRLLDLGIIITCGLTLLPVVDPSLRRSVALRLLRLTRAFGFGLRFHGALIRVHPVPASSGTPPVPQAFSVQWEETWKYVPLPWDEFVARCSANRDDGWLYAYDVDNRHLEELAAHLKVPPALFGILRGGSTYPRLQLIGNRLVATLWLPLIKHGEWLEIDRVSVLLSQAEHGPLLTIAPTDCQLPQRMGRWLVPAGKPNVGAHAVEAYFRMVLEQNEEALAYLEMALRRMEDAPVARGGEDFFRLAFRLRRDLSQVKADLWRLGGILDVVKAKRLHLPRQGKPSEESFIVLSDQADYLYETASNLREQLISLIELHLNTVSFQMNRFMQLLAVVTVLAAIPASVGGLLGMNIHGAPWPVTLGQVAFGVGVGVLIVLYLFVSKRNLV